MKLALHGPMYSGKTTFAKYLQQHHGFTLIDYTTELKCSAVDALRFLGLPVTMVDIQSHKHTYRAFLQELGTLTGFNEGTIIPTLLEGVTGNIVFDNVRYPAQLKHLHGFTLVRFHIDALTQQSRGTVTALSHAAEVPLPYVANAVYLNGNESCERNFRTVVECMESLAV